MIGRDPTFADLLAQAEWLMRERLANPVHWWRVCAGYRQGPAAKRSQLEALDSALAEFEALATTLPTECARLWREHFAREAHDARVVADQIRAALAAPAQLELFADA